MRLGELLVQAGLLSRQQIEQALRGQVMWGGRLGTNLVELQLLDLDTLSRVLARQHALPAAFAVHFEAADRALARAKIPDSIPAPDGWRLGAAKRPRPVDCDGVPDSWGIARKLAQQPGARR